MAAQRHRLTTVFLVALALSWPLFASENAPAINNKIVKKSSYGSPKDHALIYFFMDMHGEFGSGATIWNLDFFQIDPAGEAMIINPAKLGKEFFLPPVPVGSHLFLRY